MSLIEVIEHLYPDVLEKCVETVFGQMKPRYVLITTPNREFNVVFDEIEQYEPTAHTDSHSEQCTTANGFRHWDHKFEWTRAEFQEWCSLAILAKYTNYTLAEPFSGLGEPPAGAGFDHVGQCTQMALFARTDLQLCPARPNRLDAYIKVFQFDEFFRILISASGLGQYR